MRNSRLLSILAFAVITVLGAAALGADPSGTWTWKFTTQNGREIESTLVLKLDGEKLTGTLTRGGAQRTSEIANGTFKDGEVSFEVIVERGDMKRTTKYKGKLEGDTIKGTQQGTRPGGGEGRTRDWEAKRTSK